MTGDGEHHLNPTLLDSIHTALRCVRSDATTSSALVTTAEGKFFSNGLDVNWARSASDSTHRMALMRSKLKQIVADLFSLQMPTIAAVTGHAAAGGLALALSHDYVLMRRDRGFLYMSELDIGFPIPDYIMAVARAKISGAAARREVALRAAKVPACRALEMGIVDGEHDGARETVEGGVWLAEELAAMGWDGEVYAGMRKASFPEVCRVVGLARASRLWRQHQHHRWWAPRAVMWAHPLF